MKFETTPRFDSDWRSLPIEHKRLFRGLMPDFNAACESHLADPGGFIWPGNLRVRQMVGVKGIWEMTWSFSGPDGRATFEFVMVKDDAAVRWRRIGRHRIFSDP